MTTASRHRRTVVACVAVAMILTATGCEWAQYGGDGSRSFDNAADTSFTAASLATLTPRWSVEVGDQWTQPVVAGGALYFTAGDRAGTKVVSLAAATGATRWTRILPPTISGAVGRAPAVAAGLVFVTTKGVLHALDAASGETRWSAANTSLDAPIVDTANVYLGPTAFDQATGAVRWTAPAGTSIRAVAAGRAIVTTSFPCPGAPASGTVLALDAATGAELWRRHLEGAFAQHLMMSGDAVVIVPHVCSFLASNDGVLRLDAASGATLTWWARGESILPDAAARGLLLLEGITAVRAGDGSVAWRADGNECRSEPSGPSIAVAGMVAFTSNSAVLCAFDVDTGTELGRWTVSESSGGALALIAADGCVYATSEWAGIPSINALCIAS